MSRKCDSLNQPDQQAMDTTKESYNYQKNNVLRIEEDCIDLTTTPDQSIELSPTSSTTSFITVHDDDSNDNVNFSNTSNTTNRLLSPQPTLTESLRTYSRKHQFIPSVVTSQPLSGPNYSNSRVNQVTPSLPTLQTSLNSLSTTQSYPNSHLYHPIYNPSFFPNHQDSSFFVPENSHLMIQPTNKLNHTPLSLPTHLGNPELSSENNFAVSHLYPYTDFTSVSSTNIPVFKEYLFNEQQSKDERTLHLDANEKNQNNNKIELNVPIERNNLLEEIKNIDVNGEIKSINLPNVPQTQTSAETVNSLPINNVPVIVANSSKITEVRLTRKKELLKQYYEQNMKECKSTKFRTKVPSTSCECKNNYFPKAIYSITTIPTKSDYKDVIDAKMKLAREEKRKMDAQVNNSKKKEKKKKSQTKSLKKSKNQKKNVQVTKKKPKKRKNDAYKRRYFGDRKKRKRKCKKKKVDDDFIDENDVSTFIIFEESMQYRQKVMTEFITDELKKRYKTYDDDFILCDHINNEVVDESGHRELPVELPISIPHSSHTLKVKLVKYEEGYYLIKNNTNETTNDLPSSYLTSP